MDIRLNTADNRDFFGLTLSKTKNNKNTEILWLKAKHGH